MNDYQPAAGQTELYGEKYFGGRHGTDPKRAKQFQLEAALIRKYLPSGRVMDVGCSTGEFLSAIDWQGEKYGMEISAHARAFAEQSGIRFDKDIFNTTEFFDAVVFRGTIQHIDEPFRFMKYSNRSLKAGGYVFFLATPNINSPVYRLKHQLPFTNPVQNFYLPDDINLPNALNNFGFEMCEIRYPYRETPYCSFWSDHWRYLKNWMFKKYYPHAFWGNSIEVAARKVKAI